jgi:hypothetical protein
MASGVALKVFTCTEASTGQLVHPLDCSRRRSLTDQLNTVLFLPAGYWVVLLGELASVWTAFIHFADLGGASQYRSQLSNEIFTGKALDCAILQYSMNYSKLPVPSEVFRIAAWGSLALELSFLGEPERLLGGDRDM